MLIFIKPVSGLRDPQAESCTWTQLTPLDTRGAISGCCRFWGREGGLVEAEGHDGRPGLRRANLLGLWLVNAWWASQALQGTPAGSSPERQHPWSHIYRNRLTPIQKADQDSGQRW